MVPSGNVAQARLASLISLLPLRSLMKTARMPTTLCGSRASARKPARFASAEELRRGLSEARRDFPTVGEPDLARWVAPDAG